MIFALPFALEEDDDRLLLLMRYCRLVASAMLEEEEEAPQAAVEQAIIGSTRVVAILLATRGSLHERWQLHERWPRTRNERAREVAPTTFLRTSGAFTPLCQALERPHQAE